MQKPYSISCLWNPCLGVERIRLWWTRGTCDEQWSEEPEGRRWPCYTRTRSWLLDPAANCRTQVTGGGTSSQADSVLSAVAGNGARASIESCKWIASWYPNNCGVMDPVAPKLKHVSETLGGYVTVRLSGPTQDFWFRSSWSGPPNMHFQLPGEGAAGPSLRTSGLHQT